MKLVVIFSILIVLFSSVNGVFVFDRRLNLNNTKRMGRDFTGSERYGTFTYSGTCPTTPGPLDGIQVKIAATTGNCFTTDSISNSDPTIGYVCEPGAPSTIHFGYPGNAGFIIGGPSFVATGANENGYGWGSVGLPTYDLTMSTCTASCGASCSAKYCNPSCTGVCTSRPTCVSTDSSATCTNNAVGAASGGTTYFIPTGGFTPTNCGTGAGQCCSAFAFPPLVGYRFWRIKSVALRGGSIDNPSDGTVNWQISEFNMLDSNGNRVASTTQFTLQNDGTWPTGGSPASESVNKVDDDNPATKFLSYDGAGKSIVLDFGSARSFTSYRWYTANDAIRRDMISWKLMGSNDNNIWIDIDTKTGESGYTVPTARNTIVGPFSFTL
eukprot:TRINITY_DN211_c0_g1_i2.p1 TRINITY_DN211_c0_g1~~TRINITY_DN211_c0_g1_i2.p1  ORF type:complete len:382 (+),score=102.27 TRINITY_DN211_c0_g1_i2:29-1174(+)